MFVKGEIAVLVHGAGARLFEVDHVVQEEVARPKDHGYTVAEVPSFPGQPCHEVNNHHLTKVKDRDTALVLVALINDRHESARQQTSFINQTRDSMVRSLVQQYELEEDE